MLSKLCSIRISSKWREHIRNISCSVILYKYRFIRKDVRLFGFQGEENKRENIQSVLSTADVYPCTQRDRN